MCVDMTDITVNKQKYNMNTGKTFWSDYFNSQVQVFSDFKPVAFHHTSKYGPINAINQLRSSENLYLQQG